MVLMPFQTSRPASVVFLQGIQEALKDSYRGSVDVVADSVGAVPPEPDDYSDKITDWLAYKYGRQHFDAVVAVNTLAIPSSESLRDLLWPEAPLLLLLAEEDRQKFPESVRHSARVLIALSTRETLRSALQMLPSTQHLAFLGGSSETDRSSNAEMLGNIRRAYPNLHIVEITGLSWDETKIRVKSLPDQSIVWLGAFFFDRNQRELTIPQQFEDLSAIAGCPIFFVSDEGMGKGQLGGSVLSIRAAGVVVGEQLAQLLKGVDTDSLPVREVKNSYIVDWRQLQRWGIPESRLPAEATILYKPPTVWEQYKRYIVAFAVVLALLLALVVFLLIERQRRRKGEELNSAMLESFPGLALLVNAQGEILRSNQIDAGVLDDELVEGTRRGRKYSDYLQEVTGREGASPADAIAQVIAGTRPSAIAEVPLASGAHWLEIRAIQLPRGQRGSLVMHLDITQRKQSELERIQSRTEIYHLNRVAAMGQLAASLAHELSQPLAAILSNAEAAQRFAGRDNPDLAEIREALNDIADDDRRARGVIQGMRAMLKKKDLKVEPVDLNHIASSVAQMVRNEATLRGMSVQVSLRPSPVMVKGDPIALQQVLLNLASNGLDAMTGTGGGGCLTIRTAGELDGSTATVWVDDEGSGVGDELRDKLFQPFFTTKRTGLGMGLSICQSILDSLGGRIEVKNRDGKGASFSVTLPSA